MKLKNILIVAGTAVLLISLWSKKSLEDSGKNALALDQTKQSFGFIEGPPPCSWEAQAPERVISENKNQAILIKTKNESSEPCQTLLYLRAPNFDISPNKEEQKISMEGTSSGSISWIISPRKTGSYEIAVTDNLDTKIFGISVKNMFGLTEVQGKLLSGLGTLFGPMLTIPWWWDRFKKKN